MSYWNLTTVQFNSIYICAYVFKYMNYILYSYLFLYIQIIWNILFYKIYRYNSLLGEYKDDAWNTCL